jgi:hypothetical protein
MSLCMFWPFVQDMQFNVHRMHPKWRNVNVDAMNARQLPCLSLLKLRLNLSCGKKCTLLSAESTVE